MTEEVVVRFATALTINEHRKVLFDIAIDKANRVVIKTVLFASWCLFECNFELIIARFIGMKKGLHPQMQWVSYVTQSGRLMHVMMTKIHHVGKVYHLKAKRQMAENLGQFKSSLLGLNGGMGSHVQLHRLVNSISLESECSRTGTTIQKLIVKDINRCSLFQTKVPLVISCVQSA
ncbi:hypothetical protein ACLB2K_059193 [Fragaria x ananassa]